MDKYNFKFFNNVSVVSKIRNTIAFWLLLVIYDIVFEDPLTIVRKYSLGLGITMLVISSLMFLIGSTSGNAPLKLSSLIICVLSYFYILYASRYSRLELSIKIEEAKEIINKRPSLIFDVRDKEYIKALIEVIIAIYEKEFNKEKAIKYLDLAYLLWFDGGRAAGLSFLESVDNYLKLKNY